MPKEKKPDDQLAKIPSSQLPTPPDQLQAVFQFVADMTGDAKKAAEDNPIVTSTGRPKSDLKGAAKITNGLKEEGIEAHARGIVPQPNMQGGLQNNDMYVAAKSALEAIKLSKQQSKSFPDGEDTTKGLTDGEKK